MNITIQSPYFNESSDQQTPIADVAPHGPISFTNVSKYEASHPAEVSQWRLIMPDLDEPEMVREFAIPFILEYAFLLSTPLTNESNTVSFHDTTPC